MSCDVFSDEDLLLEESAPITSTPVNNGSIRRDELDPCETTYEEKVRVAIHVAMVMHLSVICRNKVKGVVFRQSLIFHGLSWQYLWTGIHYKLARKARSLLQLPCKCSSAKLFCLGAIFTN